VAIEKRAENHGMPWEKDYGYSQALKVGDTIYLAGQVGHDDKGEIVGQGNIEVQMRQAYANVKKILSRYGATMDNVVDEILFVTDMDAAMAARSKLQHEFYSGMVPPASTIFQIQRLAFPALMVEIRTTARV
jgi:enamine deaminase RidA (YjgF/YER057c/UK114 family)